MKNISKLDLFVHKRGHLSKEFFSKPHFYSRARYLTWMERTFTLRMDLRMSVTSSFNVQATNLNSPFYRQHTTSLSHNYTSMIIFWNKIFAPPLSPFLKNFPSIPHAFFCPCYGRSSTVPQDWVIQLRIRLWSALIIFFLLVTLNNLVNKQVNK